MILIERVGSGGESMCINKDHFLAWLEKTIFVNFTYIIRKFVENCSEAAVSDLGSEWTNANFDIFNNCVIMEKNGK